MNNPNVDADITMTKNYTTRDHILSFRNGDNLDKENLNWIVGHAVLLIIGVQPKTDIYNRYYIQNCNNLDKVNNILSFWNGDNLDKDNLNTTSTKRT